jgi:DNA-directed RNA polymerase subunit RPC12/RpoP
MNKECNTVVLGSSRQDGIRCPRCNGRVLPKPFQQIKKVSDDALYIRRVIVERCHEHCFDLTPEQVETVLEIYKDRAVTTLNLDGREISKIMEVHMDMIKRRGASI